METTKKKRPPFGFGYLGSVNDKNLEYLTVLAELILFTLIGAVSWYLLIICVAFFYWWASISELTFFGKKLGLYDLETLLKNGYFLAFPKIEVNFYLTGLIMLL